MSNDIDAVHAPYYLLESVWTSVAGCSEVSLRLPSAVAIAVAAVALMAIARTYTTQSNAVLCAFIFALMPAATRYGQEAREGALVIMLAVVSTLTLHIAAQRNSRWPWIVYAIVVACIPLFNLLGLYLLVAHLLYGLYVKRGKSLALAAVPAVLVAGAVAAISYAQRSTMLDVYLPRPTPRELIAYTDALLTNRTIALIFVGASAWFILATLRRRQITEYSWILAIAIFPAPLWLISQVQNVFLFRYGLFAVPFFALIVVLAFRKWYINAVFAVLLAVLSAPIVLDYRNADGHGEDFRAVFERIEAEARPGDAIVLDHWLGRSAMHYYLSDRDVADPLNPHGDNSFTTLERGGLECTQEALAPYQRVWLVWFERASKKEPTDWPDDCDEGLREVSVDARGVLTTKLFAR
ncbi:glycosyltransferase family 39 protein [Aldersonia sp. NBC_00410]|uniref:glycosyltransferase family 39 protein n=1 Tax=Aldersonia sp. NBC_00410 TaxID=2975954 RepID=UPI00224F2F1E|nr:glycosyltransferase family 39 protein [Aldersonia sp. NBC_00410]MCX5041722.1 glycosyltransferase family 39 protein [Aldersonia sp. NBC_00410]